MATRNSSPKQTRWFSRDADALRADLLNYAKGNFSDKIIDFSPNSLGGMLLEFAAQVGDGFQYYLDYNFAESQWDTATESQNVERFLRDAGITPSGASPASAKIRVDITVPTDREHDGDRPLAEALPYIKLGSSFQSSNGTIFTLVENIDFLQKDPNGDYLAEVVDTRINSSGEVTHMTLRREAIVVSGRQEVESFTLGPSTPFRTISLGKGDIHEIVSVVDSSGNTWYEVDNLAQDTVYVREQNYNSDRKSVPTLLKTINTSKRFMRTYSLNSGRTGLRFGSGIDSRTIDTEDFSVPFRVASVIPLQLDPSSLGKLKNFGEAPGNTVLTVTYRYGGGAGHNVPPNSIEQVNFLDIVFEKSGDANLMEGVVSSVRVTNPEAATGGGSALSLEQYRALIPMARAAQKRIVSQSDAIGSILAMPGEFGRVHKAAMRPSLPGQPARLWITCKNRDGLIKATDALKKNLKVYLSGQRLIGDSIDILDCPILNWGLKVHVVVKAGYPKQTLRAQLTKRLERYISRANLQPDDPIDAERIRANILSVEGVDGISLVQIFPKVGEIAGTTYSDYNWIAPPGRGRVVPPPGGIFEMLNMDQDILIRVSDPEENDQLYS